MLYNLSHQNSDKDRFKREVEMAIGKKVTIAEKGVEVNFSDPISYDRNFK